MSEEARTAAVQRGLMTFLAEPAPELWFYFSFADGSLPEGEQFLGGLYVRGATVEAAVTRSHLLGLNPGGEIMLQGPIPTEQMDEAGIGPELRERLLTREEVEAH